MVIAGPNRGTSFTIQNGENSVGRQSGNAVTLQSSRVSKRHCVLIVSNGEVLVKDEGSANGTFVNGVLSKSRKLAPGDRISVGEFVLQLAEPVSRAVSPRLQMQGNVIAFPQGGQPVLPSSGMASMNAVEQSGPPEPRDLKEKAFLAFETRIMPYFYNLNLGQEWRNLMVLLVGVLALGCVLVSIYPLLNSTRDMVVKEAARRATFMARQLVEQNSAAIAAGAETKTDLGIVESADGVRLAVVTNLDNRILAPSHRFNQYLTSGPEAVFATKARDAFRRNRETGFVSEVDGSTVAAIEPIKVLNPSIGKNEVKAMAIVAIDTSIATPDIAEIGVAYSQSFILSGIFAAIILMILYRLTLRPLQVLNEDMDKVLKGDLPQVTHEYKFEELNPLWDLINSALQRASRASGSGGQGFDSGAGGDAGPSATDLEGPLRMFGNLGRFGMVILDQDKKIIYMNNLFEELTGIRAEGAMGNELGSVARDQSMGVFIDDLMSRLVVGSEGLAEEYDFSGMPHQVFVVGFGTIGGTAACYALVTMKAEG
jgi:PAS domain-containing protein